MLERTDIQIINELSKYSRITMKELGEKVYLNGQHKKVRANSLDDLHIDFP